LVGELAVQAGQTLRARRGVFASKELAHDEGQESLERATGGLIKPMGSAHGDPEA
jgi:hypothetical protein